MCIYMHVHVLYFMAVSSKTPRKGGGGGGGVREQRSKGRRVYSKAERGREEESGERVYSGGEGAEE